MNFDTCFTLDQMMEDAQKRMTRTVERLHAIDQTLNSRLGGRSRLSLVAALVISAAWAAAFLYAYNYFKEYIPEPYGLILLIVSLVLVAFVIIGDFVHLKYYGAILNAQTQLTQLRSRAEIGRGALAESTRVFMARRNAQWEMPLEAGLSISQEAGQIEAQLANMESLSSGFIAMTKNILYYTACIAWTVVGSYALFDFVANEEPFNISESTLYAIMIVLMVIACIIEVLIAKMVWGKTDCDVGNITLLAVIAGPIVFVALAALAVLVVMIVTAVLYIAAILIGGACLLGIICGG